MTDGIHIGARVKDELRTALVPVLLGIATWLGMQKLNDIEDQLKEIPSYTRQLAVLEAQAEERQAIMRADRVRLERVAEHLGSVDRRVQEVETQQTDIRRRMERLEQ